jgi:hypothetical protein
MELFTSSIQSPANYHKVFLHSRICACGPYAGSYMGNNMLWFNYKESLIWLDFDKSRL